eukprot:scaffold8.g1381.t1
MADAYIKGRVLGRGTFGEVIQATHKEVGLSRTRQVVAIKKIRVGEKGEGVNVTALREVKLLRELAGADVVRLLDVFPHKRGISLVFEFCESDLEAMVLRGLEFCHARWVVHRDVKPNNFLVAASGELKLADFGLARTFGSPEHRYTNQVFARWYRPPELLYGSTCYGPGVDVWAAGCVFAELLLRRPWFAGESDVEVLTKIFMALGTPQDEDWGGLRAMPSFVEFQATPPPGLRKTFPPGLPVATDDALDLLSRMVVFDASRRISASEALQHRYFRADPPPTPPAQLPKPHRQLDVGEGADGAAAQQQQQQQGGQPVAGGASGAAANGAGGGGGSGGGGQQGPAGEHQGRSAGAAGAPACLPPGGGSGEPSASGSGGALAPGAQGATPGWGMPASTLPESLQGRLERPRLGSGDIQFLRKRKLALDEAFEEHAGQ